MAKKSIDLFITMIIGFSFLSTAVWAESLELLTWKGYAPIQQFSVKIFHDK